MTVSRASAVAVAWCPTCHKMRGEPCVYLHPEGRIHGKQYAAQLARAGTAMTEVHRARFKVAEDHLRTNPLARDVVPAASGGREFDLAGWLAMRAWLRAYGALLTTQKEDT